MATQTGTVPNQTTVAHNTAALPADQRHFLLLQGPHGPFFRQLGHLLRAAGARVSRVAFNRGDEVFWNGQGGLIRHEGAPEDWPAHFDRLIDSQAITDLVLYGDVRAIHAEAITRARARGLVVHIFEEGYLRPFWASYERNGSNGHSRLMELSIPQMRAALSSHHSDGIKPPSNWGDMRQHMFWGAVYHFMVMVANGRYPNFQPHRAIRVTREFQLNLLKFLGTPLRALRRVRETQQLLATGSPYHIVLLQLEHDASFQAHSDFTSMAEFTETVITAFKDGAPRHHRLVFKLHPLEDNRGHLEANIARQARAAGLEGRIHCVPGGKLAGLLSQARSAVTVNSTAAQQALFRGMAVRALGRAVFAKPELVSDQPLAEFFADPTPPDRNDYKTFRQFLLETSQVPGGFYAARSRQHLLRQVVDLILAPQDPYDTVLGGKRGAARPQLGED